ncbi:MAG: DNA-binding transcriptional regulator [Planctomycetota bacterium]|jgi:LacI family transcriptional regulator
MYRIPKVILLLESSRQYSRGLLIGIGKYARFNGPWSLYTCPEYKRGLLPHLKEWDADGVIAHMPELKSNEVIEKTKKLCLPVVFFGHPRKNVPGCHIFKTESKAIGEMGAEHLLERGFKNFAYSGYSNLCWSIERLENFTKKVKKASFEVNCYERPISNFKNGWAKEQQLLINWLKNLPKPIGLMACNDDHGRHIVDACRIADIKVPEEVAILGVDNDELICGLSTPQLSSIAMNTEKAGYEGAQILDKLMSNHGIYNGNLIVHPTYTITRQSTDTLAVEDQYVAAALRFICNNAKKAIQVSDVAEAVTISRRNLESRFRKVLNRSILNEIKRLRINLISKMLTDTDMTVSQIAKTLNFCDAENVSRYFKHEKKMSPQEYRKKHCIKTNGTNNSI